MGQLDGQRPRLAVVYPSRLHGEARVPGSKSYTHRAILAALLSPKPARLLNPLRSSDTEATLEAAARLGAEATASPGWEELLIEPPRELRWTPCIDARESGTTMRLVTGVLGLLGDTVLVYGRGRLHRRPVRPLLEAMNRLGVSYTISRGCCPPHALHGPARPGETSVDAGESSQYLSALLLLGAGLGELRVEVLRLESKPYVDITVKVLEAFGASIERQDYKLFHVTGRPRGAPVYRVPGDWSSAAQLLAAVAAAGGEVELHPLDPGDPHPDRRVTGILEAAGAKCAPGPWGRVRCSSPGPGGLEGFEACIRDSPDLGPALAAVAAVACGVSRICCVERLRLKESDRVQAILDLAARAGAEARLQQTSSQGLCIVVRGRCGPARPATYRSHGDHRVAMAAAALALAASAPSRIEEPWTVEKSYPEFWSTLQRLGARVELA